MRAKVVIFILVIGLIPLSISAQYIHFSQFYAAPLVLAPSFAGANEGARTTINYRDQWTGIKKGVYITEAFGFDIAARKINSGFGLLVVHDKAGTGNLGRLDVGALYSWNTQLTRSGIFFRPGLELKFSQRGVDFEKLVFPDQLSFDGIASQTSQPGPVDRTKFFLDATVSALIYSDKFWIGLTVDHLFRPNDAFYDRTYRVPLKYTNFGGYKFGNYSNRRRIGDKYMVSYQLRYQGGSYQLDLGGYWDHEPILVGIWLRGLPYLNITGTLNMDAMIFLVGYHIFNFTIGYSYDLTVSPMLMRAGGSHELSLSYTMITEKRRHRRKGAIPCPKM